MEWVWMFIGILVGFVCLLVGVGWIIMRLLRASGKAYRDTIDKM